MGTIRFLRMETRGHGAVAYLFRADEIEVAIVVAPSARENPYGFEYDCEIEQPPGKPIGAAGSGQTSADAWQKARIIGTSRALLPSVSWSELGSALLARGAL